MVTDRAVEDFHARLDACDDDPAVLDCCLVLVGEDHRPGCPVYVPPPPCPGCGAVFPAEHADECQGGYPDPEAEAQAATVKGTSPVELAHSFASAWREEHSYTPGRGWFHRQPGRLWTADDEALVVRERVSNAVAAHAAEPDAASIRAVRSRTVVTEMEPLLGYRGGWDCNPTLAGLPDDTVVDLATGDNPCGSAR